MTDDERGRGILTTADRDFLRAPDEYSRQARHARQDAIADRVRNAVLDHTLLFEELSHEERERIFGNPNITPQIQHEDPAFEDGLRDALAIILEGTGAVGLFDTDRRPENTTTERLLVEAFERLAWRYKYRIDSVELDVEAERIPWHDLEDRLKEGQNIDAEHLGYLLAHDDVDTSAIQEQVRKMLLEDTENTDDE